MSLHRRAAKRDAAEPAIVEALEALGCVVWRVSGKGLPDLIVLRSGKKWLADVKGAKEKPTPAQEKAWEEAATKARCAVFILRTPEDAQKMLNNALQPWEPAGCVNQQPRCEESRKHLAQIVKSTEATLRARKGEAAKVREGRTRLGMGHTIRDQIPKAHRPNYNPPRSKPVGRRCPKGCGNHGWDNTTSGWVCSDCAMPPAEPVLVDAAKEAEATFAAADGVRIASGRCAVGGCWGERAFGPYCGTHRGMGDPD